MPDAYGGLPRSIIPPHACDTYFILPGSTDARLILLCDHASNAFPDGYGSLGVSADDLKRHIAYDIGAAGVTRRLSEALNAPAILTRYSRLLIDPNRGADDPTLIMRLSDGAIVPGNRRLTADERAKRVRLYYEPYHQAIDDLIDRCGAAGEPPALLSIHTFTETWKGAPRPWHAGILWDEDDRLAGPMLKALSGEKGLVVGNNEPYSGRLVGDTMWRHGTQRGIVHALVEIRQDIVRETAGQIAWADRLARVMRECAMKGGAERMRAAPEKNMGRVSV